MNVVQQVLVYILRMLVRYFWGFANMPSGMLTPLTPLAAQF